MSAGFGPLLLAAVSVLLIVGGVLLTWRDIRAKRGGTAVADVIPRPHGSSMAFKRSNTNSAAVVREGGRSPPTAPTAHETRTVPTSRVAQPPPRPVDAPAGYLDAEAAAVTIIKRETTQRSTTTPVAAASPATAAAFADARPTQALAFTELTTSVAAILAETDTASDPGADGQRWPSVEARWVHIEREIDRAVATVTQALAAVALDIGPAGEVGWSFKNRGFGSYRRIAIDGRSIGWLRAETNQEHMLICKVRAHAADHALLNASAEIAATRLDDVQLLEVLARVLKPSAAYAAWLAPKDRTARPAETAPTAVPTAAPKSTEKATAAAQPAAWSDIAPVARSAFHVAAGALSEADAELTEVADFALDPATKTPRWRLAVSVGPKRVADMVIDLSKSALDISSNPLDPKRLDLARRRRLDLDGLEAHGFAEAIASCAWPAVADSLERGDAAARHI